MYIFLPGNPSIEFVYGLFLKHVEELLEEPIYFIKYNEHVAFNLEEQIINVYKQIINIPNSQTNKIILIGYSFGGYIALKLLELLENITKVILICPIMHNYLPDDDIDEININFEPKSKITKLIYSKILNYYRKKIVKNILQKKEINYDNIPLTKEIVNSIFKINNQEMYYIKDFPNYIDESIHSKFYKINILFSKNDYFKQENILEILNQFCIKYTVSNFEHIFINNKKSIDKIIDFIKNEI